MSSIFHSGHFAGSVAAARRIGDLSLAETNYAPGSHVPVHAHDHAICCLVLNGGFTEHAGRKDRVLEAGSLLFHPADEAHAHNFHRRGGHCFNIQFGLNWANRMSQLDVRWPSVPVDLHRSRGRWIVEQLRQEMANTDPASELIVEGCALALLGEVSRFSVLAEKKRSNPSWLRQTVELLHAMQDRPFSLAEIAAVVNVHPTHLARTFRSHFGCSMGEYARRLRIESACHRLAGTIDAVAEIALDAGFADQAHFSRVFKRLTGMSPAAYRKNSTSR